MYKHLFPPTCTPIIYICSSSTLRTRIAQSVQLLSTGWTVRGSNPDGEEVSRTRPDRFGGPPSLL
jgi:hypothetical protein